MRGAYYQYCKVKGVPRLTDAVEEARQLRKEQAELRLARLANGVEGEHPKDAEKGRKPSIITRNREK